MMRFAPKPRNDFDAFIRLYYEECRRRFPRIAAIAGKWSFEDLIPGMSDFDTRFVVEDGMTTQDWCDMSTAVGEAHLDICKRFADWVRILEHLPGINLTWTELTEPAAYYPEYPQWTFYHTTDPARLGATEEYLKGHAWSERDEYFHLEKFCLYYGRYNRTIDPPVNLGPYENKYPLHSRFMHYFCPPLQSALSILVKRPIRGKMETIRLACEIFKENIFKEMREAVERHYEIPALYEEPALTHLENRLEHALQMLRKRIAPELTLIPEADRKNTKEWKACLKEILLDPYQRIFDSAKFSRLMKGRLYFFACAPSHFDSTWPIENELRRMRRNFFDIPFGVSWEVMTGERLKDPAKIVTRLSPGLLTRREVRSLQEFIRLLSCRRKRGEQKSIAIAIANIFDEFFSALSKITFKVRELSMEKTRCE